MAATTDLAGTRADLELIGRYLARRDLPGLESADVGRDVDVLVLCGSGVVATVEAAARAFHDGVVRSLLVTGGVGHSTPYLVEAVTTHPTWYDVPVHDRPEAAILADVLRCHLDVPGHAVRTEEHATNCGDNAELSLRILLTRPEVRSVLLVQDPTMQRRTHAGFDHHQRLLGTSLEVLSQTPFVPVVGPDGVGDGAGPPAWTLDRFVSLVLGEVRRLHDDEQGYGPRGAGFLDHVDVPAAVVEAAARVAQAFPNLRSRRA
jgi:hypothetical protein